MRESYGRAVCEDEPILRARTTRTQRGYLPLTARIIQSEGTIRQRNAVYELYSQVHGDNRIHFEIVREFVQKVVVCQAEKINGRRTQRIDLYFNSVGHIRLPVHNIVFLLYRLS